MLGINFLEQVGKVLFGAGGQYNEIAHTPV